MNLVLAAFVRDDCVSASWSGVSASISFSVEAVTVRRGGLCAALEAVGLGGAFGGAEPGWNTGFVLEPSPLVPVPVA